MHLGYQQSSAGLFQWLSECMCKFPLCSLVWSKCWHVKLMHEIQ
jgi:hypothetical protein